MASVRQLTKPNRHGKRPWVVEYTDQTGKRRRSTPKSGLKKDADRERLRIEVEVERGHHTPDADTLTVGQACDAFLAECERRLRDGDRMRQNTLTAFRGAIRNHIVPFLGSTKLSRFTAAQAQAWIDDLRQHPDEPRSPWTLRLATQIMRLVIAHAQRSGRVARNVMVDAMPRRPSLPGKVRDIPSKDDIRRLLAVVRDLYSQQRRSDSIRLDLIVEVAILTGMRVGEILALQWKYVLFDLKMIRVRHSTDFRRNLNDPKSAAGNRDIPLPSGLATRLAEWKLARPSKGFVFPTSSEGPITNANMQRVLWRDARKAAGLDADTRGRALRFHDLRHVAASLFIESGLPPKRVMYLMGHSSIQITFDRYGHLFPSDDAAHVASQAIENDLLAGLRRDKNATTTGQVIELSA